MTSFSYLLIRYIRYAFYSRLDDIQCLGKDHMHMKACISLQFITLSLLELVCDKFIFLFSHPALLFFFPLQSSCGLGCLKDQQIEI